MTLITWHDDDIQPYCISMRILESTQDFYLKFHEKIIEISILPMNIINFLFVWCCDVMTSCHDVTKPDLPISARRCARELILFCFNGFFKSLSSKMLLDFHLCDAVTSWRHVMTSLNLINLSQLVDGIENLFFFCFNVFLLLYSWPWIWRSRMKVIKIAENVAWPLLEGHVWRSRCQYYFIWIPLYGKHVNLHLHHLVRK